MSLSLFVVIAPNVSPVIDQVRMDFERQSAFWFSLVKYSGYAVAFGCLLEAPETFVIIKRWWLLRFRDENHEETELDKKSWIVPVAALGLIIIVVGIVAETYFEGKVSDVESDIRTHESDKITKAEGDAATATREAGDAAHSSIIAQNAAKGAVDDSTIAVNSSSKAVDAANGARKEADTFEQGIVSAKKEAADAVSRLADAEQRLADSTQREVAAESKLSAIKTPRSFVKTDELIAALKPFKGTEYTFTVSEDDESIQFTKEFDSILGKAGWIRKQPGTPRIGIAALSIFSTERKDLVEVCIATGVTISLHSDSPDTLIALAAPLRPKEAQAAMLLRNQIGPHVAPDDEHNVSGNVTVDLGSIRPHSHLSAKRHRK